jgi:hypothetical protein
MTEEMMSRKSFYQKIRQLINILRRWMMYYRMFTEKNREDFLEINEIKDWSKGESYFGNGRLF